METFKQQQYRLLGEKVVGALQKRQFDALYVDTGKEAVDKALEFLAPGMSVGFGGSMTMEGLGMPQAVAAKGGVIMNEGGSAESLHDLKAFAESLRKTLVVDLYLASVNAITLAGELVNLDGGGNRVAALTFGPRKAVVIAGVNKVCQDEDAAWERLRMIAAPRNNLRLSLPNPCTKAGHCVDCKGEYRACRIYSVLRMRPLFSDITVILVGEELGY